MSLFFGFFFLVLAALISVGFFVHELNDLAFGSISSGHNKENLIFYYASYFSGTLLVFIGYSSYLIPVFFMILGIKKIFNINTNFFVIHLISLVFGIAFVCLLMALLGLNISVVGLLELNFLYNNFYQIINNQIYYIGIIIILFIASIFFYFIWINNKK